MNIIMREGLITIASIVLAFMASAFIIPDMPVRDGITPLLIGVCSCGIVQIIAGRNK